jgi:hypothetical protein
MKERRSEMFWRKHKDAQVIKIAAMEYVIPLPVSMKLTVPEWYKKSTRFINGEKKPRIVKLSETRLEGNRSMKACVPFFDSLSIGYAALLWQDLEVIRTPTGAEFRWLLDPKPVDARDSTGLELIPVPEGHSKTQYVWHNPFSIKTPPGYSILITHPLNRYDLPFTTLSGVHDSDSLMPQGHLPFYLNESFEGVIPKGTPMFQIIPFKRDNWVSVDGGDEQRKESARRGWEGMTKLIGHYKENYWHKKNFD